jgi:hypothetical protein
MIASETLFSFDQIMRVTTIDLWQSHIEKAKLASAAINLKSKMTAIATHNATESTALAIARATETFQESQTTNAQATLRLTNLEKSIRRQEQKTNEVTNIIKHQNKTSSKNSIGSQTQGSLASPVTKTLHKKINLPHKQRMVDLTEEEDEMETYTDFTPRANKRKRRNEDAPLTFPITESQKEGSTKMVQWKDTQEIRQFNPNQPTASQMTHLLGLYQAAQNPTSPFIPPLPSSATFFQPAPPPTPLLAPSLQNPLLVQHTSPFHHWNNRSTQSKMISQPLSQTVPQQEYQKQNNNAQRGQAKHPFRPRRGRGFRRS